MRIAQRVARQSTHQSIIPWGLLSFLLLVVALTASFFTHEQSAASNQVILTEFSDFQCPYCKRAASVVALVRQTYGERVKVVFKQMPLPMHAHAFKAAQASVCAREQGRFWEYHDLLFAASDLSDDGLSRMASTAGLNQTDFSQCISSEKSRAQVERDAAEAQRLGVSGTPTFFVNDRVVRGASTFAALKQQIDSAMIDHPLVRSSRREDGVFIDNATSSPGFRPQVPASKNGATRVSSATTDQPVAATTTTSGLTLSPATVNFGYQLVGTSSLMGETVTNSSASPLIITDISVLGRDRSDFDPTYSFTLPVTLAADESVAINLMFTPAAPWRAGARDAKLKIQHTRGVDFVALTGIGATCGGPLPSCSSACADSDDDGLNDAWEIAGGIDINNDGQIDAINDVLLPDADPNKPDVYVKYDYMVAATTSPDGMQPHSHQPPAAAIQQVVDAFALHGINLHIDPQHTAIPEVFVTTRDPNPTVACALNGLNGPGYTFVTMQTLREQYFGNRKWGYHYGVFAHSAVVPDTAPCCDDSCGFQPCTACPSDAVCGGKPDPTSSGNADVGGANFILAFGTLGFNNGLTPSQIGIENYASIFMHELGHNFGLMHGSLAQSFDPVLTTRQQQCLAYKPNYLSVMGYNYYQNGIFIAAQPGSSTPMQCNVDADCPANSHCTNDFGPGRNICYRVDYSGEKLLDLNEASLNEVLGVGGAPGNRDILSYCSTNICGLYGPAFGPIDWNNDGNATETNVQVDIDGNPISTPNRILSTTTDWDKLNFKFQCTAAFARDIGAGSAAKLN